MNSKKFLDQLGLIALISKIKQALNGKQNVDMVVTIAQSGNAYSCDTSIANIVAAHDAGRDVYAVLPPVSDGSSTKIKLVEVQNYGSGTVMMVSFGGIINNGTNNVLYSVSGTRQNNLDAWSVSQKTMQEKLVSGTSIKTINGNTLLGSGDVTVNGSERVAATWDASASAYTYESAVDVDTMYQSFYSQGKVLELHLVNGNYNGLVLTCHGGYTSNNERHLKFSGSGDGKLIEADVVGTAVTVSYEDINAISGALYGKQDTIGLNNKVDADYVEYRGADTSRLGNGDSMTEALQTLDRAITNLGTPNEIASITTQESSASGGNNVVTITDTDGTSTSFNVKNGIDGQDGADGADGVSLGEIALVQTTGDSEESVMSQRAVTAEVTRASMLEIEGSVKSAIADGDDFPYDLYYRLDWLSNENGDAYILTDFYPKDNTVRFTGAFAKIQATTSSASSSIISSYRNNCRNFGLWLSGTALDSIGVQYSHQNRSTIIALQDSSVDVWHTFDLSLGQLILDGEKIVLTTQTTGASNNTPMRILDTSTKIRLKELCVYESDVLVGRFIPCKRKSDGKIGMWNSISGNFYAPTPNIALTGDSLTNSKLLDEEHYAKLMSQDLGDGESKMMSQAAITRELEVAKFDNRMPNYFAGLCLDYPLGDYPTLDPRTCDGISILVNWQQHAFNRSVMWQLEATGQGAKTYIYGIGNSSGSGLRAGFLGNYFDNVTNGGVAITSETTRMHSIYALDFKTGEFKWYLNGTLVSTTQANEAYDYANVETYFAKATNMVLGYSTNLGVPRFSGMAVFGHVLSESEVASIYDDGSESVIHQTVPVEWNANALAPHIYDNNWTLYITGCTQTRDTNGVTLTRTAARMTFGFNGLSGMKNFVRYEWSFTVLSGSATTYSRGMIYNNNYYKCFTMIDEQDNDVSYSGTLVAGNTYHVVCEPTLVSVGYNAASNNKLYILENATEDFSMLIHPILKVTERGAAIVCDTKNYRGTYWEQTSGIKLPIPTDGFPYSYGVLTPYYDTFKPRARIYNSSAIPQFNGQIAVDTTSGKVYIGYLTGTGGTWKQVSN